MARLVLIHGFTQTAASWAPVTSRLQRAGHEIVALDVPGHGGRAAQPAGLWDGATVLAEEGGGATWVGYSLGGRLALHVALSHPAVVERLVLVGATAGIDDESERAERRATDESLAADLERDGLDAFLTRWLAQPLFATLTPNDDDLAARRTNTAAGLAASLRQMGTGAQDALWDRLGEVEVPTLVVAGALDAKFSALAHRLAGALPHARAASLPGCGHACHLEAPDAFVAIVEDFLTEPAVRR